MARFTLLLLLGILCTLTATYEAKGLELKSLIRDLLKKHHGGEDGLAQRKSDDFLMRLMSEDHGTGEKRGSVRIDLGQFIDTAFMLQPFSSGQLFLHTREGEVWADQFDGTQSFRNDATFLITSGLAGSGVSLRSSTSPKYYIRHSDSKLYLQTNDNSDLFKKDATFNVHYGLGAGSGRFGISFESMNRPGYFISLSAGRAIIARMENTDVFKKASTFKATATNSG